MKKLVLFLLFMFIITLSATAYAADYVTRAEFCKILVEDLALSYDISQVNNPFQDVNSGVDYYEEILICYGLDITYPYGKNFGPTSNISREQAAYMLYMSGIDGGVLGITPIDIDARLLNVGYERYPHILGYGDYPHVSAVLSSGVLSVDSLGKFNLNTYLTELDLDRTKLQLIKQTIPTTPVQLDISLGSIVIQGFPIGNKCYQGGTLAALTNGNFIIRQSESTATSNSISVNNGDVRVTLAGVNSSSGMSVIHSANLILTLVGDNISRINIDNESSIEISGPGSLIAKSLGNSAGIGGTENNTGGNITINGGTITATGFNGIGSGNQGRLGNIIINGGIITVGGNTGIGSNYGPQPYGDTSTESRGNITINGGIINITYATWGIGGFAGNIEINGGTIIAQNIYTTAIGGPSPGSNSIVIDESAEISVSFKHPEGRYYLERIFDLELKTAAALVNKIPKFETVARGASGLTYQWQSSSNNSNWLDIPSETSSVLSTSITTNNNGYYFRCRVTNAYGNVAYTTAAKGYILAFTKQPTALVVELGELSAFEVTSSCPNVSYQWQKSFDNGESWQEISGEVYSTLLINTSLNENKVLFRCQITASNGDTLASNSASLTVLSNTVSYTARYYLKKADGKGYDLFDQIVTESPAGTLVSANERTYDHFTENHSLSITTGTVSVDNSLILSRYYDRNVGSGLTGITIPDGITSIEHHAFYGYSSLISITIPDSVTSIGYAAFSGCGRLTSITIPDSVASIGDRAFEDCSSLTSITIPDSVTSIGDCAFSGCSSLTIKGELSSYAEIYASKYGIPFVTSGSDFNIDYTKSSYIRVFIEGKQLAFDVNPQIVDGRTLVPMRAVFEAFGLQVKWDDASKTAEGISPDKKVKFVIGSNKVLVDGIEKSIDVPASIIEGRTLIPLRFLSENMGYNVVWNGEANLILLSKN